MKTKNGQSSLRADQSAKGYRRSDLRTYRRRYRHWDQSCYDGKEDGSTEQKVETINYGAEYSLGDDAPEGMTINAETGKITWAVAEDYFDSHAEANDKITITVNAKTIVSD